MRVTEGDHWAEVSEKPLTWGEKADIRDAADGPFWKGFAFTLVTTMVTAWSLDADPSEFASWETVPTAFGDKVFKAAIEIHKNRADDSADPTEVPSES